MTMDSEQSWAVINALLKIETAAELTAIMAETDAGKAASAIAALQLELEARMHAEGDSDAAKECRADVAAHPGCVGCVTAARRRSVARRGPLHRTPQAAARWVR